MKFINFVIVPNDSFSTLSFRNSEEFSGGSWQSRGVPMRNRRDLHAQNTQLTSNSDLVVAPHSNSARDKRDAPECVVNYKAQRQLLFGCSQPDIVEVRPKCNDDGDEGT